jgi:ABC-type branched-subunit amino acid transport system substrate-binding protein
MKKLVGIVAVLALVTVGCGDRGSEDSAPVGGGDTTTTAAGSTEAAPGDWGDLEAVCGPRESGGELAADDNQGVSADTIKVGTVADPGFSGRLGLNQELFDAGDAFVEWCNAAGGINGKKLELTKHDAKLTDYQPVVEASCKTDFAMVGGGALQDNLWADVGAACGLIDIAGFSVTAAKAGLAGEDPTESRSVQPVPNPGDRYPVGPQKLILEEFPGTDEHVGFLAGDLQTTLDQKIKERRGFEAAGFTVVHDSTYNILGESNWKPFATAIESDGVRFMKFIGEGANGANLELAMQQVGYVPEVRYYETNFYDQTFLDAAGDAAEGVFIGAAFIPMEEADTHPATKLYVDNVEKIGGKKAVLGLQSTSAWLLFATLAKACDQDDNLTRDCILEGAQEVTEWTGGGLHGPTSPATNEGAECFVVLQVKDGKFTRWTPTDEDFACDPDFVATVEPAS